MKQNEKKLIVLAGILFAAVVLFRVVPMAASWYQDGRDEIARLENRIANYRELIAETGRWIEREQVRREEVAALGDWVFTGSNPNFIVTSVQRELRRAADEAGMTVRETALPDFTQAGDWLIVNQEISFLLDRQEDILKLLSLLDKSAPHLFVTDFSISRSRRQYSGTLVVTGFGRTELPAVTASDPL